jgi:hypothetical protein
MSVDVRSIPNRDVLASARERVSLEPIPPWVVPCDYAIDFKTKNPGPVTRLLVDHQFQAELQQEFIRVATRLETMQAVQHHSQWRVEFSPLTQFVQLHSIKIRRGGVDAEHAALDRVQFLQREAGLEGWILDGGVTLLLLLEDVRPGDILEWSFTVQTRPILLPESRGALLSVPDGPQLGKLHLVVRCAEARPLKWKASSADLAPSELRENGEVCWVWKRENFLVPEPEEGTPCWHSERPWIQISDCPDWQTVAAAVYQAWKEDPEDALAPHVQQIRAAETDVVRQVGRAIQLVQDEFRYLSVNIGLGGQIPASAETVIRRRYGDCKDLAFLLVQLLRRLGVKARPVLVHTLWQKSIRAMLPSPGLFNHVVAEYEIGNETRWVDVTLKAQGGGALNRVIPNFGLGLPIDPASSELVPPPAGSLEHGAYELKECFLVDTTGDASYLGITVTATGGYAESLRLEFENIGLEAMAKKRLQACANRFSQARRVDSLQFRDEREANRFTLAETLEVNGFLVNDIDPGFCWLQFENSAFVGVLPLHPPNLPARRAPLALPFPCRVIHTVEIESPGLEAEALPAYKFKNDFFEITCTSRGVRKFTTVTFSLTVHTDSVSPQRLPDYQKAVEQVLPMSGVRVRLPLGYARMRRRSDFGALPALAPAPATVPATARALGPGLPSPKIAVASALPQEHTPKARADLEQTLLLDEPPRRRRKHSRSSRESRASSWKGQKQSELLWILGFAAVVAAVIGFLLLISYAAQH